MTRIPSHVAIIMDGNGRWAEGRGLPRLQGHRQGARTVRTIVEASRQAGLRYLTTSVLPDPDLIIRTGGEKRLSDFLTYEAAYSELYFCDVLWPDFGAADLHQALGEYSRRERRFGKTSDQVRPTELPSAA